MTKGDKQMDITDAAKKRACELANAASEGVDPFGNPHGNWEPLDVGHPSEGALTALARHLQQTSDVANYVSTFLVENCPGALVTRRIVAKLRPLILPDEPCKHVPMRKQHGPGWHCCECGAPLKFVEVGDG